MLVTAVATPFKASANEPEPAFRILNIKAEYGHVVFEIEHMNTDGTRNYIENYVVRGEEWFKKPRKVNAAGQLLLADGTVAPYIDPIPYGTVGLPSQYGSFMGL